MAKGNRYYKMKNVYRIHGYNKTTGRYGIIGYEKIPPTLLELTEQREIKGHFRIVEWVLHYDYNDGTPSGMRSWEVRLRLPEGYTELDVQSFSDEIMDELTDPELTVYSEKTITKYGEDFIEYSRDEGIKWNLRDNARKMYKYPTGSEWGRYEE